MIEFDGNYGSEGAEQANQDYKWEAQILKFFLPFKTLFIFYYLFKKENKKDKDKKKHGKLLSILFFIFWLSHPRYIKCGFV